MDIEKENLKTAIDDANNDVEMLSIRLREQSNHVHLIEGEFEKLKAELESLRQYKAEAESQEHIGNVCVYLDSSDYESDEVRRLTWATFDSDFTRLGVGDHKLYARPVPAGSCAVPGGYTAVKTETVQWLLGENGDFVCPTNQYFRNKPTQYFWRKTLRESLLSAIPSNSEGEKS